MRFSGCLGFGVALAERLNLKLWTASADSRLVCLLMGYSAAMTASVKLSRGERFGHLTAVEQARFHNHRWLWWFKCSCGTVTVYKVSEVKSGDTKSCGACGSEPISTLLPPR
jgi:hypothetical protein